MSGLVGSEAVEAALSASSTDGCVVIASRRSTANLRWAGSSLTTNGFAEGLELTVVAVSGESAGVASREGLLDADDIRDLVGAAEAAARDAGPAEDAAPLVTPAEAGEAGDWTAAGVDVDVSGRGAFTEGLAEVFETARAGGYGIYGFGEQDVTSTWLGSSTGVRLRHDQPGGNLAVTGRTPDGSRSVWAGRQVRRLADIDTADLGAEVTRLMEWSSRRVDLPAGRYDVVLPPQALADLMIDLYWAAAGRTADDGRSVFSKQGGGTRLGEQVAASGLTLSSDPRAAGLECVPFNVVRGSSAEGSVFDNGLPLARTDWVRDGVLTTLVDSRSSAARGGRSVAPPIDNLVLDGGGSGSTLDLVGTLERGLLLTTLWYIREVDPQTLLLTGLTRDGVFLVEGGEVVGQVNNFRWNESPVDLLTRVRSSGATVPTLPREWTDYFTLAAMPPVLVEGFNMSTVSPAT